MPTPIHLSALALPVDAPLVSSSVILYFFNKFSNVLFPKSERPPSCLTLLTLFVMCCFGTVRSQSSNLVFASVGEVRNFSHVKLVLLQTMYSGYQKPSSDLIFCFPPSDVLHELFWFGWCSRL